MAATTSVEPPLRPRMAIHGTSCKRLSIILRFGGRNEADRHADDQRRLDAFLADQAHDLDQGGRRIADADDGAVELAQPLALRIACTARVLFFGLGLLDHVRVGNELMGTHAEMLQARLREADADHFDIGDDRRAARSTPESRLRSLRDERRSGR